MENNDMNGEHNLSSLDTKINDRGFFERILREFKETLKVRNEQLDERFDAQKEAVEKAFDAQQEAVDKAFAAQTEAIQKAEVRLDGTLKGFPQEYARRLELEQMIAALDETSTVLAQKVVDSAKALAEAQTASSQRLAETQDKTDERVDLRFKKIEDFQAQMRTELARDYVTKQTLSALTEKLEIQINRNRDDITNLTTRINVREGEQTGGSATWRTQALIVGSFGTILGIIIILSRFVTG